MQAPNWTVISQRSSHAHGCLEALDNAPVSSICLNIQVRSLHASTVPRVCRAKTCVVTTLSPSKAICISKQLCTGLRKTGAHYTDKLLKFSHDFPFKVGGAYCTSVRIVIEFLW